MAEATWEQLMQMAEQGGGAAEVVPDGTYGAAIDSAEYRTASTGKDMLYVKFKITDVGPYQGKPVYNNFVLADDNATALGIFRRHMEALGIPATYIAQLPEPKSAGLAVLAGQLENRHCTIVVGHRMWQGQQKNEVNDVKPPVTAGAPVPGVPAAVPAPAPQPVPAAPAPVVAPAPAAQPVATPVEQSPVYTPPPAAPVPVAPQPVAPAPAPAPAAPQPLPVAQPAPAPVAAPPQQVPAVAPDGAQPAPAPGAPPF